MNAAHEVSTHRRILSVLNGFIIQIASKDISCWDWVHSI